MSLGMSLPCSGEASRGRKRSALARVTLVALAAGACAHASSSPVTVQPRVVDVNGLSSELASHRGHPIVVNFWATWCEPCVEEFPELVDSANKWRSRGVVFVSVSADDPKDVESVRDLLHRFHAGFDSVVVVSGDQDAMINDVDPAWSGALPSTFVYDAEARLVAKRLGGTVKRSMLDAWLAPLTRS